MGLVGTIPGLVSRHLANPTCAPAVSLTPCLLAKPLLQKLSPRMGGGVLQVSQGWRHLLESSGSPAGGSGDGGGPGSVKGGKVLYCTLTVPFWTSRPQQESQSPAAPSPEMKSFNIQTTQMKCHGNFDKNQEEVKLTLGGGRGEEREGETKRHRACLAGRGRTPSLQRQIVTKGQERSTPASGSSEAREMPESTKPSSPRLFKTQDSLCKMNEGGGPVSSKRSPKVLNTSPPNPTWVSPEPGSSLVGSPSCPHGPGALEGAGPWEGGSDEDLPGSWVTEPAGWGSSRSLMTGPHCYCFCGEPWNRTRRVTRATPAPERWGR